MPTSNESEPRRRDVAAGLAEHKLDAMLVSHGANLRYLSGFTGSNGSLLILDGKSILFTDPRYRIQAAQESTCQVKVAKGPLGDEIARAIQRSGARRIG